MITSLGGAGSVTGTDLQGINGSLTGNFALGGNINAIATASWNAASGFTPLGSSVSAPYTGTLDGLGHSISNLTINRPASSYVGLFGVENALIKNVGLLQDSIVGLDYVGALVGKNSGTVSNSYSTGAVSGRHAVGGLVGFNNYGSNATVANSHASGTVSATGIYTGGLVGYSGGSGLIINSYSTTNVGGTAAWVGGLLGVNYGTVSNTYATGNVTGNDRVGGLVGFNQAPNWGASLIQTSYSTGVVSGVTSPGALVGRNEGTISSSYWNTSVNVGLPGAGISISGAVGLSTTAFSNSSNFAGFNFTSTPGASGWVIVNADGSLNALGTQGGGTFPMLASEYSVAINNVHQLQLMAMNLSANYTLTQNINATATAGSANDVWAGSTFIPVGGITAAITAPPTSSQFSGTFDGLGLLSAISLSTCQPKMKLDYLAM